MSAGSIPQIFFEGWFWLAIVASLCVVLRYARRRCRPRFPKIRTAFIEHKKTIVKITDALVLFVVLSSGAAFLYFVAELILLALSGPQEIRTIGLQVSWVAFLVIMIYWSGLVAVLIGSLSAFQQRLSPHKRIVLLVLNLLPVLFAAMIPETTMDMTRGPLIRLGATASTGGWIVNGPGILTGQPFFDIMWQILCKLGLVSGDVPD